MTTPEDMDWIELPPGIARANGGRACDMAVGPCACGAMHTSDEHRLALAAESFEEMSYGEAILADDDEDSAAALTSGNLWTAAQRLRDGSEAVASLGARYEELAGQILMMPRSAARDAALADLTSSLGHMVQAAKYASNQALIEMIDEGG